MFGTMWSYFCNILLENADNFVAAFFTYLFIKRTKLDVLLS